MLLGLSVLIGWISHAAGFRGPVPELLTMHFSTALSLILCGVAALCVQDDCPLARAYPIAMACAAATAIIGFLNSRAIRIRWASGVGSLPAEGQRRRWCKHSFDTNRIEHCAVPDGLWTCFAAG